MKLVTWNVNGLRAAERNGMMDWFHAFEPDVIGLQEVKAELNQLPPTVTELPGYETHWHHATKKKGYSGVALWTKPKPQAVTIGCGNPEIDCEGRVIRADYRDFTLFTIYFPNGSRDHSRVPYKLAFYEYLLAQFDELHERGRQLVVCGDFNTAHQRIDLANPTSNAKTTGFLPEERAWVDTYLAHGFRDVYRDRNPEQTGAYTWWSYRPGVRERNIGWRIDYFLVSASFVPAVKDVYHLPEVMGSDHCPVVLELDAN